MDPLRLKPLRQRGTARRHDGPSLGLRLILPGFLGGAGLLGADGLQPNGSSGSNPPPLAPAWSSDEALPELDRGSQLSTDAIGGLASRMRSPGAPPIAGVTPSELPPIFRWGSVLAHPSVGYGVTYGTGLLVGPGRGESTAVQTVSPGLALEIGHNLKLDYDPRLVFYTVAGYHNAINQAVNLQGATQRGDWSLTLNNHFGATDNPLIETAQQTQQTVNTTRVSGSRPLTSELSLNLDLTQMLRWSGNFNRTFTWSNTDSLNYRLRDNLILGLVGSVEYDQVARSVDMTNERLQGSVQGKVGEKFTYSLTGGVEFREFLGIATGTKVSPIFSGNLNYQLTEKTGFGGSVSRSVSPSLFNNEFIQGTTMEGSLHQRLFEKMLLKVSGGFRQTEHSRTLQNKGAFQPDDPLVLLGWIPPQNIDGYTFLQTDNYAFVRIELSARILERGTVTLFWSWGDNSSTLRTLNFLSHQTGIRINYGF